MYIIIIANCSYAVGYDTEVCCYDTDVRCYDTDVRCYDTDVCCYDTDVRCYDTDVHIYLHNSVCVFVCSQFTPNLRQE